MKLLIITQKVNKDDPILGFFHAWIAEFAKHFNFITVICLEKGDYDLPLNVKVLSLGKEIGISRLKYLFNFYKYIWQEKANYDAVFVHMNQEYVLLGAKIWFLLGKKVYMWRNHHAGSFLTDMAAMFCTKVFCTSKYSYTAKYKKTVFMPVGINTDLFKVDESIERMTKSILFLGRISPIKRPDLLVDALIDIHKKGHEFSASIVGDALAKDEEYYQLIKNKISENNLGRNVGFFKAIPNHKTAHIYNLHSIFVNLSTSGMYDKTIFEAMACGCMVLVSNRNLEGVIDEQFIFTENNMVDLVGKLEKLLLLSSNKNEEYFKRIVNDYNSLKLLGSKIKDIISCQLS